MENDAKTKLATGNAGIRIKKEAGTLADYLTNHLKPWAEAQFTQKPKSLKWYRNEINVLLNYGPVAGARLDEINNVTCWPVSNLRGSRRGARFQL
jgi:hypothetical protein